jgi:hypothetical protein
MRPTKKRSERRRRVRSSGFAQTVTGSSWNARASGGASGRRSSSVAARTSPAWSSARTTGTLPAYRAATLIGRGSRGAHHKTALTLRCRHYRYILRASGLKQAR